MQVKNVKKFNINEKRLLFFLVIYTVIAVTVSWAGAGVSHAFYLQSEYAIKGFHWTDLSIISAGYALYILVIALSYKFKITNIVNILIIPLFFFIFLMEWHCIYKGYYSSCTEAYFSTAILQILGLGILILSSISIKLISYFKGFLK